MAVLAFGFFTVLLFRFFLLGHPQREIGHNKGKLTPSMKPLTALASNLQVAGV
jgi:hypothetical protein